MRTWMQEIKIVLDKLKAKEKFNLLLFLKRLTNSSAEAQHKVEIFGTSEKVSEPIYPALISTPLLLARYESYRYLQSVLLTEVFECLSREALENCGKKLGIFKQKTLHLNQEEEMEVLFNYSMFHYYVHDKNAIDRYLDINQGKLLGEEKQAALALQQAQFAILKIQKTLPYGGVLVADLLREAQLELLMDKNLSETGRPGLVLATTIVRYPQFIITTGAGLPLNGLASIVGALLDEWDENHQFDHLAKIQQSQWIARLLKTCFYHEVSKNIRYR